MERKGSWLRGSAFLLEMEGNRRVILSGCRGISAYTEECVVLCTPFGRVAVYGQDLEMGCMTVEGVTVTGRIHRIELEEEGA